MMRSATFGRRSNVVINTLTIWNAINCYPEWLLVSWVQWFSKKLLSRFKARWQGCRLKIERQIRGRSFFYVSWTVKRQIIHNYPSRLDLFALTIKRTRFFKTSYMYQFNNSRCVSSTVQYSGNFGRFCSFSPKFCVASMLNQYSVMKIRKANRLKFKGLLGWITYTKLFHVSENRLFSAIRHYVVASEACSIGKIRKI